MLRYLKKTRAIVQQEGWRSFLRTAKTAVLRTPRYRLWWRRHRPTQSRLDSMTREYKRWKKTPLISVIMPVYNPDPKLLKKALDSVLNQIYPHFELCICDDASSDPRIRPILTEYEAKDSRVKVVFHEKNQHISSTSNSALELAIGDYIALLDHDDELAPQALFEVAKVIVHSKTRPDVIYSDEDKITERGAHHTPFFKPEWSPELLHSIMYIGHLGVYRRSLIEKIKGFRKGYEGSQDLDLALRCTEQAQHIVHIPQILYHWRQHRNSTAGGISQKSYALKSAKRALNDSLKRRHLKGKAIDGLWLGSYRTQYEIQGTPLVSIIIPFRDQVDVLKTCLVSLQKKTTYPNYELILVDNQSKEPATQVFLKTLKNVTILTYDHPFHFSKINNFASKKAEGDYLLFLNNDTEVITPHWIESLLEHAQQPEIGAVGAKLLYPNHTVQHAGVVMGIAGTCSHAFRHISDSIHGYLGLKDVVRNVSGVTAACLLIDAEKFKLLKGFNEAYEVAYQDIDLCLRALQKGYRNVYTPYATLLHYESLTRKQHFAAHEKKLLLENWGSFIKDGDPYYSPHLTLTREDYSVSME